KLKSRGVGGGGRLFLLNPGEGSLPLREWPLENFIRLARRLMERDDDRLLVIGREAAGRKAGEIVKALAGKKCADLSGQTSLEELMELFHMADALICNDCGLAHLAMLTPVREFVLFGPESPQIFGPMKEGARFITARRPCSPCLSVLNHRNSSCADNVCLKAIDPDEVYEHITRSL
ncbi:MAG: glycosyltransferase family 9 protein, partial [Deltaproteobacteria bacterium]